MFATSVYIVLCMRPAQKFVCSDYSEDKRCNRIHTCMGGGAHAKCMILSSMEMPIEFNLGRGCDSARDKVTTIHIPTFQEIMTHLYTNLPGFVSN